VPAARQKLQLREAAQRVGDEAPPIEPGVNASESISDAGNQRSIEKMLQRLGHT